MKFSLLLVVALCAYAAGQDAAPSPAAEAKFQPGFGDPVKQNLKDLIKEVGILVVSKAKDILTDGLRLHPTEQVQELLKDYPSNEGILDATIGFVLKKASDLADEHEAELGPGYEGLVANFGYKHKIYEAEQLVRIRFNKTIQGDIPSQEGVFGGLASLGGIIIKELGSLIGGQPGEAITAAGNVIGHLFYALPPAASEEDTIEEPFPEGIVSSAGRFLFKGAGKLAGSLLRTAFDSFGKYLGNAFLARGSFFAYPNIQAPASEIFEAARRKINIQSDFDVQVCFGFAEANFTQLFQEYETNCQACIDAGQTNSKQILSHVEDIVLDAVKRVEDAYRETGVCFEKDADDDRVLCLNTEVPDQITVHRKKVEQYGYDLANYVKQFSDINTEFDICLVGYLGVIRREIYHVVDDFYSCVAQQEFEQQAIEIVL